MPDEFTDTQRMDWIHKNGAIGLMAAAARYGTVGREDARAVIDRAMNDDRCFQDWRKDVSNAFFTLEQVLH